MSLFTELKRRNVFKVTAAYVVTSWLVAQVAELAADSFGAPEWVMKMFITLLALGLPFAVIFAWAFEMTPEGLKKEKDVDRSQSITKATGQKLNNAIIGVLVVALAYFAIDKFVLEHNHGQQVEPGSDHYSQQTSNQTTTTNENSALAPVNTSPAISGQSIAVLPFVNMSSDAEQEYFSDGITEEVLNLLAKIPELKVTSRSSAFSFKGQNLDIPTIAQKLGVAHILEGSVRKSGKQVRITTQLIRAEDDVHMWSEAYDRKLDDIFAIQDEIAREVVSVLQVHLLGETPAAHETNTEAYTSYLRGLHFLQYLDEGSGRSAAAEAFNRALELDPDYAPAWAGLGRALRAQANWGQIEHDSGNEAAREAVLRALELDNTSADAWSALSLIQWVYDWDWIAAEGSVRTALMHGPNDVSALMNAAYVAKTLGQSEKAIEFGTRALNLDPLNPTTLTRLSGIYLTAHRYQESNEYLERLLSLYPDHEITKARIAFNKALQGKSEEALQLAQMEEFEPSRYWASTYALHDLGRTDEARQALDFLVENTSNFLAYQIAGIYAYFGEPDKAFEWLEIAYQQRDGGVTHILGDASFNSIHDDPRWERFLLKLGLLDAWRDLQKNRSESALPTGVTQ